MSNTLAITGLNSFVGTHVAVFRPWVERGKLDVVAVGDHTKDDLSALLAGTTAVVHLSQPPPRPDAPSYEAFIGPALGGVRNLIAQAAHVPSIEAVSVISSGAAVVDIAQAMSDPAAFTKNMFTEDSWAPPSDAELAALDSADPVTAHLWYAGTKAAVERAAHAAAAEHGTAFALSTVCPPIVYGPAINVADAAAAPRGISDALMCAAVAGKDAPLPPHWSSFYVDARPRRCRFLAAAPKPVDWHVITDLLRKVRPQYAQCYPAADGPGVLEKVGAAKYDSTKSVRELGITYRPLEDTFADAVDYFAAIGKIHAKAE
ncbi:methylglyoxal reductase (NADPH-dependent) gre2 [Cryptotrichosporon argae]